MLDHYATLGVTPLTATEREIKKAFRKLAIRWHPDKCSQANAAEMFSTISTAYNTLADTDVRRKYDRELRLHLRAQARKGRPTGFKTHGVGFDQRTQTYRSREENNHVNMPSHDVSGNEQRCSSRDSHSSWGSEDSPPSSRASTASGSSRASSASGGQRVASAFANVFGKGDFEDAVKHWDTMMDKLLIPVRNRAILKIQKLWRGALTRSKYARHIKHIKKVIQARQREKSVQDEAARRISADAARRLQKNKAEVEAKLRKMRDQAIREQARLKRREQQKQIEQIKKEDEMAKEHAIKEAKLRERKEYSKVVAQQRLERQLNRETLLKQKKALKLRVVLWTQQNFRLRKARHNLQLKILQKQEKLAMQRLAREQDGATKIQSMYRSYKAKEHVKIVRTFRLRLQKKKMDLEKARVKHQQERSAVILQKHARRKLIQTPFKTKLARNRQRVGASVMIQSFVRRIHCRRRVTELKRQQRAAILLQKNARLRSAKRQVCTLKIQREEEKRNSASVKIQMMIRQRMAKQRVFSLREGYKSAVLIQCKWRQALAQKSMRRRICGRNESAAIKIQSCVRKVIAQRKRLYLRNVVLVQSCCRKRCATKQYAKIKAQKQQIAAAATSVQSCVRMWLAKMTVKTTRRNHAAIKLQSTARQYIQQRAYVQTRARARFSQAVIKIQCLYRKRQAKQACTMLKVERILALRRTNITKLQSLFRMHLAQLEVNAIKRENAALCIQTKLCRIVRAKSVLAHLRSGRKSRMAQTIQCMWRCAKAKSFLCALKMAELDRRRNAARTIQSIYRTVKPKAELKRRKMLKAKNSAIVIQALVRRHIAFQYTEGLRNVKMSIKIQTWFRWQLARQTVLQLKLERQKCVEFYSASRIQCAFRRRLAKQKMQALKQKRFIGLVVKCQSYFRKEQAIRRCNTERMQRLKRLKIDSATKIQCKIRQRNARNRKRFLLATLQTASATTIQKTWRRHLACKALNRLRVERQMFLNESARKMQTIVRMHLAYVLKSSLAFDRDTNAATVLQCLVRCTMAKTAVARRREQQHDKILFESATTIQKHVRGFIGRRFAAKHKLWRRELAEQQQIAMSALQLIKSGKKWGVVRKKIKEQNQWRQDEQHRSSSGKKAWQNTSMRNGTVGGLGLSIGGVVKPSRPTTGAKFGTSSPRKGKLVPSVKSSRRANSRKKPAVSRTYGGPGALPSIQKTKRPTGSSKSAPAASATRGALIATKRVQLQNTSKRTSKTKYSSRKRSAAVSSKAVDWDWSQVAP
jgi:curved DNA-binding protein CbpA